jgi:uncharacterized membrane protein (UPF0127 family)
MLKPAAARIRLGPSLRFLSKYLKYIIIGLALIAVIAVAVLGVGEAKPKPKASKPVSKCGPYRTDTTVEINGTIINAEVPKNSTEFEKGLGGRPCILPNQGMLFGFKKPGQYPFWMKDMKFPVDIIWISTDHKVAAEEINLQPSTYPDRFVNKDSPAQYVLEIKANLSKELKMTLGTPVNF